MQCDGSGCYLEHSIDVGSQRAARSVLGVVRAQLSKVVIDLAFVVEGRADDELPECVLGAARIDRADARAFAEYDDAAATL